MIEQYSNTYTGDDGSAAEQFRRLSEVLGGELLVPVHYAAPARPRTGRLVVADGTEWDPLSAGVPRLVWYNGTTWVALNA